MEILKKGKEAKPQEKNKYYYIYKCNFCGTKIKFFDSEILRDSWEYRYVQCPSCYRRISINDWSWIHRFKVKK